MQDIELCEQSKEDKKAGRVKVVITALRINDENNPSDCNNNGIRWLRKYVEANMDSFIGMPYTCSFIDDDKTYPSGHGQMKYDSNGNVIFENSEVVGVVETAEIVDMEINGMISTVLQTTGYLYYQRYPNLVSWLREQKLNNEIVDASIEINGKGDLKDIVYEHGIGARDVNGKLIIPRTPVQFDGTSLSFLFLTPPGDDYAQVIEVNSKSTDNKSDDIEIKNKEVLNMADNAKDPVVELNEKIVQLNNKINDLNACIKEKDTEINKYKEELNACNTKQEELNSLLVDANKTVEASRAEVNSLTVEIEPLRQMNADAEKAAAQAEVNSYFETIKKENGFTDTELNSLQTDYVEKCDLDGLKAKETELCVNKFKEMKKVDNATAELNSINTDSAEKLFFSTKQDTVETNSADDGSELFK